MPQLPTYVKIALFCLSFFYLTFSISDVQAMHSDNIIDEGEQSEREKKIAEIMRFRENFGNKNCRIMDTIDQRRISDKNQDYYLNNMENLARSHITYSMENIDTLVMIKQFCNVQHPDSRKTLLHMAIDYNNNILVHSILLACLNKLDVNLYDFNYETSLHAAVRKNNEAAVKYILVERPLREIVEDILEQNAYKNASPKIIQILEQYLWDEFYQYDKQPRLSYENILQSLHHREYHPQIWPLICFPKTFIEAKKSQDTLDLDHHSLSEEIYHNVYNNDIAPQLLDWQIKRRQEFKDVLDHPARSIEEKSLFFITFLKKNHAWITLSQPGDNTIWELMEIASRLSEECLSLVLHYFRSNLFYLINLQNNEGSTVLHNLLSNTDEKTISMVFYPLLQFKPNINLQNNHGNTLLHLALNLRNPDLIQRLLGLGPNLNLKNTEGTSALEQALYNQLELALNGVEEEALKEIGNYALTYCSKKEIQKACTNAYQTLLPNGMSADEANNIINEWKNSENSLPAMFRNAGILDNAWYSDMREWYQDQMDEDEES